METSPQKNLERLISHKAMQMSNSFPCKIWALGFICGVCITYLFLVASAPFKTAQLGFLYSSSPGAIALNSSILNLEIKRSTNSGASPKDAGSLKNFRKSVEMRDDKRIFLLYSAWSAELDKSKDVEGQSIYEELKGTTVPKAPHLEDCKTSVEINNHLDKHGANGSSPPWTLWRGSLGTTLLRRTLETGQAHFGNTTKVEGSMRSHWSCYFFPETSQECREHAFDLMKSEEAWDKKIITVKENYTSKEIWAGRVPRVWGEPWSYLQPTTDIDGSLLLHHRKMDRRWWRAQAIRYLMRFQTEYTCHHLNMARHTSFGLQAAEMVLRSLPAGWPKVAFKRSQADIEQFVWSNHRPWIPRPLLSMHVRMGDKACEMKVVGFETYMQLADRIREHFPNLNSIWLSTEMQEVIDKSRLYLRWNFYYTNVMRQVGNMTMATYEAGLGRETSTNYPLVNFIMATEADFFIGALGSTWCYLIDGMRNTGGKVMSGYLSVNKDRFW